MEPIVYEINLSKKYIMLLPPGLSAQEYNRVKRLINEWAASDQPLLVISAEVQLVKITEES